MSKILIAKGWEILTWPHLPPELYSVSGAVMLGLDKDNDIQISLDSDYDTSNVTKYVPLSVLKVYLQAIEEYQKS